MCRIKSNPDQDKTGRILKHETQMNLCKLLAH
jgi:hypothetical protein